MDSFLSVSGVDFGNGVGVSADLANGAPTGVGFTFGASQPTADRLLLTYSFTNNGSNALTALRFLWFVDPDIGPAFDDEFAAVTGTAGVSRGDPTGFEVGDPVSSPIFFAGLLNGNLNNAN